MPITRQQRLNSRQLYNLNDAACVQMFSETDITNVKDSTSAVSLSEDIVHSTPVTEVLPNKDFESSTFQQNVIRAASSSSEYDIVQTVVAAFIEPLPRDKNKSNKLIQKSNKNRKVITKKKTKKKGLLIDFDAIEIANSPDNKKGVQSKTKEINLPRTLIELNKNVNFDKVETISSDKGKCSTTSIKQKHKQTSIKLNYNEIKGKTNTQVLYKISNDKENRSPNLFQSNAEEPLLSKKPTKKKRRVSRPATKVKSKPKTKQHSIRKKDVNTGEGDTSDSILTGQEISKKLNNVTKIKTNTETIDNFINSVEKNVLETPSQVSVNTTASKKRRILNKKTILPKRTVNKSSHPDFVTRQPAHDGYESLYSDDELFNTAKRNKRKIGTSTTTRGLKLIHLKPISFKTTFDLQKKPQSSSSSSLPNLEIEVKTSPRPVTRESLTDSDLLLENINAEPINTSPNIKVLSNINLTKQLDNKSTPEEFIPVFISGDYATLMPANSCNQVAEQDAHCSNNLEGFDRTGGFSKAALEKTYSLDFVQDLQILDEPNEVTPNDENVLKADYSGINTTLMLSPQTSQMPIQLSNAAIMSWTATGLPSDATAVFKSTAEAVLSGYAEIIKAYLQALRGPVYPSLNNLYDILIKQDHDFHSYFKKI